MLLKTLIYTTNKTFWIEDEFAKIIATLRRARGVEVQPFNVRYIKLPKEVPTYVNGGTYIQWSWIKENCPADGHNAVCLHISTRERKRLGLKHPNPDSELGGVYNRDADSVFDFVVIADKGRKSYDGMTAFERIFIHEISHGFSHWRSVFDFTHLYDYTLKNMKGLFDFHDFTLWNKLRAQLQLAVLQLQALVNQMNIKDAPDSHKNNPMIPKNLYDVALKFLGKDASPNDVAPDELGCAETVSMLIRELIAFPVITGTWTLWDTLRKDSRFEAIGAPEVGAIVISPTGSGNGSIPGHTGICGHNGEIMSNDSYKGTFEKNFTEESWKTRYMQKGGFPVYYYRLKI